MKKTRRDAITFDGVERMEVGGPPTAFRIWKAGANTTDHGPTLFTERSAALLLEEQARRGNRYSIDVNHLSLDKSAPIENQRAAGWFAIEVRDGELWAVDVEWTDLVRAGLCKTPPEWRYHSPAYDVDESTGEVVSLLNLAITNTPATWGVTALASRGASQKGYSLVKLEDIKAAFEGADEDKKAAAWAAIAKAMASTKADGDEPEKKDADEDPEKKDSKKAADDEPEKKDGEDEPEKKDSKQASAQTSDLARIVAEQDRKIRHLLAKDEASERATILASVECSPELAEKLRKLPLATAKEIASALPKRVALPGVASVNATRGASQGGPDGAAPAPEPSDSEKLAIRMGLKPMHADVRLEGTKMVFPTMTPAEIRASAAKKEVK
jgi:hypothetical protein